MQRITVKCATYIVALAVTFGLVTCSCAADPVPTSEMIQQLTPTRRVEEKSGSTEMLARGAKMYTTLCQPCHGDRYGKGRVGSADPHNEKGHTWHHPDAQLKDWTLNGKPGFHQDMPAFKEGLEEQDVEAILDFIKTWWTTEQREMQADISRRFDQSIIRKKKGQ